MQPLKLEELPAVVKAKPGRADTLEDLLGRVESRRAAMQDWPAEQRALVQELDDAICDLHAEAMRRLIRGLKAEPAAEARLRSMLGDQIVYAVLRRLGVLRASLNERIEQALDEVRPMLHGHGGDVMLLEVQPPDTVRLQFTGACDGCPSSAITLRAGVREAIRAACPEITQIHANSDTEHAAESADIVSPFAEVQTAKAKTWNPVMALDPLPMPGQAPQGADARSPCGQGEERD